VLDNGIPSKGALLTLLTVHWFELLTSRIPGLHNHFLTLKLPPAVASGDHAAALNNRSMQVRKLRIFPLESIVRGYITGSAWAEYKKSGTVHGTRVEEGLRESEAFAKPIWTPSTKAEVGEKDENITREKGRLFSSQSKSKLFFLIVYSGRDCWGAGSEQN
jgi:phosphoribosylaminoimidazole-succinocarboxamide synthase